MKCHALFAIFEKSSKILNCRLLQIIGGALRVKSVLLTVLSVGHLPWLFWHQLSVTNCENMSTAELRTYQLRVIL